MYIYIYSHFTMIVDNVHSDYTCTCTLIASWPKGLHPFDELY